MSFTTDDALLSMSSAQHPSFGGRHAAAVHHHHRRGAYASGSYHPSDDFHNHHHHHHHLQPLDPGHAQYNSQMAMVPRQGASASGNEQQQQGFMIQAGGLFPSSSQTLADMQQQQQQQHHHHHQNHHPSWGVAYDSHPHPPPHSTAAAAAFQPLQAMQFNQHPYPTSPPINNVSGVVSDRSGSAGGSQNGHARIAFAASLDPATGIFYRTPEHPRLRTAQACEKCRTRKAKCSGEHPTCQRCQTKGLVCEYAKEGRVRGPNKPKRSAASAVPVEDHQQYQTKGQPSQASSPHHIRNSLNHPQLHHTYLNHLNHPDHLNHQDHSHLTEHADLSQAMMTAYDRSTMPRRDSLSLGEHRPNRPRPPNLNLDASAIRLNARGFHPDSNSIPFSPHTTQQHHTPHTAHSMHAYLHDFSKGAQASMMGPAIAFNQGIQGMPHVTSMEDARAVADQPFASYTYDENRSPSTSSSASIQGHQNLSTLQTKYSTDSETNSPLVYTPSSSEMASSSSPSMMHSMNAQHTDHPADAGMHLDFNDLGEASAGAAHDGMDSVTGPLDPAWYGQHAGQPQHDPGSSAVYATEIEDNVTQAQMQLYPIDLQMQ